MNISTPSNLVGVGRVCPTEEKAEISKLSFELMLKSYATLAEEYERIGDFSSVERIDRQIDALKKRWPQHS